MEPWPPTTVPRWHWLGALAIGVLAAWTNLGKAYHIDDLLYLRVAEQILATPLDPYRGQVLWDAPDGQPSDLYRTDYNPPLWKYVLAAGLAGGPAEGAETRLHLLAGAATALAALACFQLSRRFVAQPLWATAMIVWSPFFLPGQNLMLEPPLLFWSCLAVEAMCRSWQGPRVLPWALAAGFLAAAAALTKYTGGLLLPILGLGCLRFRRPRSLWFALPFVLTLAAWQWHGWRLHGEPHLGAHGVSFAGEPWLNKAMIVVRLVGAVTVFGPFLLAFDLRTPGRRRAALLVAALAVAAGFVDAFAAAAGAEQLQLRTTRWQQAQFFLFTANGVVTLLLAAGRVVGTPRRRWLGAWIAILLAFNVCCTPFNAVRHLLLALMPLTWLVADAWPDWERRPAARWGALALSGALASALAAADRDFANAFRQVADRQVRALSLRAAAGGNTVWVTGNWGFVHYALRAGAQPWMARPERQGLPEIRAGDYVVHTPLLTWTDWRKPLPPGMAFQTTDQWQPNAPPADSPATLLGQFLRTVGPGTNYYSIFPHALPWYALAEPAKPEDRKSGAWFYFPTLGDLMVYRVVVDPRPAAAIAKP